jgi:hypothetical protein
LRGRACPPFLHQKISFGHSRQTIADVAKARPVRYFVSSLPPPFQEHPILVQGYRYQYRTGGRIDPAFVGAKIGYLS